MPISEHIAGLRARVGCDLLLLPGVAAVIQDAQGRILVQRRTDDGTWGLPSGAIDPGETPAQAVVREVYEETGLHVIPTRIRALVGGGDFRFTYPNGDVAEYVAIIFDCALLGGELAMLDGESMELRWVTPADMPILRAPIQHVFAKDLAMPWFARLEPPAWSVVPCEGGFDAQTGTGTQLGSIRIRGTEIVELRSHVAGYGIGTALLEAVCALHPQVSLVTTHDNLSAIRFLQRRGFVLAEARGSEWVLERRVKAR